MERNNNNKSTSSLFGRMSARASFISKKDVKVTVQLLNDSETINNEFKKSATGRDVLDYVCECLNISEKDYFGLRYQDHHRHRYWVDLTQSLATIGKQFKSDHLALRLRFRYYPSSAAQLREEITRYQLNVQLQRDLLHGRLYCPQPIAAQLAAYILQSQVGDAAPPSDDGARYVSEYKLLLKQTPKVEEKIAELHQGLRGMSAAEAERRMIEMACQLETYGFDPYTVKDPKNPAVSIYIGATHRGILVFHGSQKAHHMQWSEVTKLDYTGSELRIYPCEGYEPMVEMEDSPMGNGHLNSTLNQTHTSESMMAAVNQSEMIEKENDVSTLDKSKAGGGGNGKMLRYLCPSRSFAKHLWVHLLSQKTFFNEATTEGMKPLFSKPRIPIFTRGSTFRFPAQRVLREIETSPVEERAPVSFARYELPKQTPRSEMPAMTKYQTLPNLKLNGGHLRNGSASKSAATSPTEEKKKEVLENFMDFSPSSSASTAAASPASSSSVPATTSATVTPSGATVTPTAGAANVPATLGEPIAHSTPKAPELTKRRTANGDAVNGEKKETAAAAAAAKQVRFTVDEKSSSASSSSSITSKLINVVFFLGLLMLLLVVTAIVLFERQETADFVESKAWLVELRAAYYEPIKQVTLQKYAAVFNR